MNKIAQDMQFRQLLLKYAKKYGVTKAVIRYKVNRQHVYRGSAGMAAHGNP